MSGAPPPRRTASRRTGRGAGIDTSTPFGRLALTHVLATSGDAKRHIEIAGVRYGHIFDARTGWPARGAPRSITVAAATCSQAGSYSTLAMLQGEGAEAFLEAEGVRYWCLR